MHRLVQTIRFESARKLTKVPEGHPCSNLYGLAFKLEIHLEGEMDNSTGFVTDFKNIEKEFEPETPKQLEELDENSCKWPIGHPDEKSFYFCGRSSLKDFSYCKLHLLYAYQPKGKKEEITEKEEVPEFIEKKIKSA